VLPVPEFIGDLPLHALVTHFAVVLLPLAVLGSILVAIWPWARRRFGWLTVFCAAVAAALVQVSADSGVNLKDGLSTISPELGNNPLIAEHERLGDLLIWWALGLFAAVTLLMIVHTVGSRRAAPPDEGYDVDTETDDGGGVATATATETRRSTGQLVMLVVVALATIGVAVGAGIHVYRVGDAGARAVWLDTGQNIKQQGN
jgi:membrane associated rhomboid family serine protease